jgi:hypothetical protein
MPMVQSAAWSPHGGHACGGVVVRPPRMRWWLESDFIFACRMTTTRGCAEQGYVGRGSPRCVADDKGAKATVAVVLDGNGELWWSVKPTGWSYSKERRRGR